MTSVTNLETRPERLWREFVEARARALETVSLDDGIAVGRIPLDHVDDLDRWAAAKLGKVVSSTSERFERHEARKHAEHWDEPDAWPQAGNQGGH